MGRLGKGFALFGAMLMTVLAFGQAPKASWSAVLDPADLRVGEFGRLIVTAKIQKDWHIYQMGQTGGPVATAITLASNKLLESAGDPIQPPPQMKFDPGFNTDVGTHEGEVSFAIPVRAMAAGSAAITIEALSQACDASTCDIPNKQTIELSVSIAAGEVRSNLANVNTSQPNQPAGWVASSGEPEAPATSTDKPEDEVGSQIAAAREKGLASYLWLSFVFGLLALLTPCVFPMIPVTVSFFSKNAGEGQKRNIKPALAYCAGIVGTFTGLGLAVTLLFGASGIQRLATNPFVNLGLAVLFIVLAANLFGVFEIQMPSWLVNKSSAGSRKGGLLGPALMGLTFSLTSFTCTVPFVGTLLVGAAQGDLLYPTLGMLAFSSAFALPFFLLALFPHYLAKMPKSGSWLASVKVAMGFLELAAAVKFLSNADLVWQLGWLTREVFLALWAGIAAVAALYLVGWVYLPHETPGKIGWLRRSFGIGMAAAAVYCLAGMQGRSLGELSAFLPPSPYPGKAGKGAGEIAWTHKYDDALAKAKEQGKPLFVNFTGVTCTNCRWMEQNMFPQPAVLEAIGDYIPVELFTDRGTAEDLKNREIQQQLTGVVTLPVYVLVSPEGKALKVFQGSTRSEADFVRFLTSKTPVALKSGE